MDPAKKGVPMSKDTLTVTDNRTGRTYEIPVVENCAVSAMNFRQIKVDDDDFGLMVYDPGFKNTASCVSRITFIDGEKGILRYRGYPIDQLAKKSSFLEVAYLITKGELPTAAQMTEFQYKITHHTLLHESLKDFISSFNRDGHPMGIVASTVAALSTFYPDAKEIADPESRQLQMYRLLAKMPTIAAFAFRHSLGQFFVYPDNTLSYSGNFLSMLFKMTEPKYEPNPILEKVLDVLFILHADHEQNCSANAMRSVGSSQVNPFCAMSGAISALYGPLHGGANEAVLRMLRQIGKKENIPDFIQKCKKREVRLMGFGHRVYKNYDPRATIIKELAHQVFEVTGSNPLLDIALELEKIALEDEYFVKRKLYPNVDFYSGIIYQAMGFPVELYPVLFAIGRTAGWLAQWEEMLLDKDQKIARPRQIYLGEGERDYVPMDQRG